MWHSACAVSECMHAFTHQPTEKGERRTCPRSVWQAWEETHTHAPSSEFLIVIASSTSPASPKSSQQQRDLGIKITAAVNVVQHKNKKRSSARWNEGKVVTVRGRRFQKCTIPECTPKKSRENNVSKQTPCLPERIWGWIQPNVVPNESLGEDVSHNVNGVRSVARRKYKAPWPSKVMSLLVPFAEYAHYVQSFRSISALQWRHWTPYPWKTFCERTLCSSCVKQGRKLLSPWRHWVPFVRLLKGLAIKIDVWENPVMYASTRDWSSLYSAMRSEPETAAQSSCSHFWEHSRCLSSACIVVGAVTVTPAENFVSPLSESSPSPRKHKKVIIAAQQSVHPSERSPTLPSSSGLIRQIENEQQSTVGEVSQPLKVMALASRLAGPDNAVRNLPGSDSWLSTKKQKKSRAFSACTSWRSQATFLDVVGTFWIWSSNKHA